MLGQAGKALMTIHRDYRWFYLSDWPQLPGAIPFGPAKGRCEHCRRPHGRLLFHLGEVGGGTRRRPPGGTVGPRALIADAAARLGR
jgi:hypothetical protein